MICSVYSVSRMLSYSIIFMTFQIYLNICYLLQFTLLVLKPKIRMFYYSVLLIALIIILFKYSKHFGEIQPEYDHHLTVNKRVKWNPVIKPLSWGSKITQMPYAGIVCTKIEYHYIMSILTQNRVKDDCRQWAGQNQQLNPPLLRNHSIRVFPYSLRDLMTLVHITRDRRVPLTLLTFFFSDSSRPESLVRLSWTLASAASEMFNGTSKLKQATDSAGGDGWLWRQKGTRQRMGMTSEGDTIRRGYDVRRGHDKAWVWRQKGTQ